MLVPVIVKIALVVDRPGGVDLLLPPHAETLANNPAARSIKNAAWRRRLPVNGKIATTTAIANGIVLKRAPPLRA